MDTRLGAVVLVLILVGSHVEALQLVCLDERSEGREAAAESIFKSRTFLGEFLPATKGIPLGDGKKAISAARVVQHFFTRADAEVLPEAEAVRAMLQSRSAE